MFNSEGFPESSSSHSSYLFWSQPAHQLTIRIAFHFLLCGKSQSSTIFQLIDIPIRDIETFSALSRMCLTWEQQGRGIEIKFPPPPS